MAPPFVPWREATAAQVSVLVDTNVLVAAARPDDALHGRARSVLDRVSGEGPFTTDHVLVETWHVIRSRAGRPAALRFWLGLRETSVIVEAVTLADLERARSIAERWADQDFDLVDCTSFAVMERLGCRRAATFDHDFAVYRYGVDRAKAFEVIS